MFSSNKKKKKTINAKSASAPTGKRKKSLNSGNKTSRHPTSWHHLSNYEAFEKLKLNDYLRGRCDRKSKKGSNNETDNIFKHKRNKISKSDG